MDLLAQMVVFQEESGGRTDVPKNWGPTIQKRFGIKKAPNWWSEELGAWANKQRVFGKAFKKPASGRSEGREDLCRPNYKAPRRAAGRYRLLYVVVFNSLLYAPSLTAIDVKPYRIVLGKGIRGILSLQFCFFVRGPRAPPALLLALSASSTGSRPPRWRRGHCPLRPARDRSLVIHIAIVFVRTTTRRHDQLALTDVVLVEAKVLEVRQALVVLAALDLHTQHGGLALEPGCGDGAQERAVRILRPKQARSASRARVRCVR